MKNSIYSERTLNVRLESGQNVNLRITGGNALTLKAEDFVNEVAAAKIPGVKISFEAPPRDPMPIEPGLYVSARDVPMIAEGVTIYRLSPNFGWSVNKETEAQIRGVHERDGLVRLDVTK